VLAAFKAPQNAQSPLSPALFPLVDQGSKNLRFILLPPRHISNGEGDRGGEAIYESLNILTPIKCIPILN
jgi:hypothetical protein